MNNLETYNIEGINGSSEDKQLAEIDVRKAAGTEAQFKIALINNTNNTINNVKILGNLPTNGEFVRGTETITNNLQTTLKTGISAQNCTIYYSANMSATSDLSNTNNGWTTNLSEVENARAYLIEIPSMPAETNFETTYIMQLPTTLSYDLTSYTGYQVLYNEAESTITQKVKSPLVGLTTGEGIKLETTIEATVGNDILKDGDIVKNGEVIRYKITTKNNGTQTLENIELNAMVPEGTVVVVPEEGYVYSGLSYYTEKTDMVEVTETIPSLAKGQSHVVEYEVRVKMDTAKGTQITNKATAICGDFVLYSNELKNTVEEAKIRVTIKRVIDESVPLVSSGGIRYLMFIENFSNETVKDLKVNVLTENVNIVKITNEDYTVDDVKNEISIAEIPANGTFYFRIIGTVAEGDIIPIKAQVNVTYSNGKKYRSNKDIQTKEKVGAEISLTTSNNGAYVNQKDTIIYNIVVKNTSTIFKTMAVQDNFSEYLEIEEVYLDNVLVSQITNEDDEKTYVSQIANEFEYYISIAANSYKELKIVARVKEIDEQFDIKYITNSAKVIIAGTGSVISEEVRHILKGTISEDDKNIVSGLAWLDANQDGQKDPEEKTMTNINVRLFDISTNTIAQDKNGNKAETKTDSNGQYTFTKIKEGQYIVLFEYDTNEYELTTYKADGVSESQNSNVILKTININGQEKTCAVTDTINLTENVFNINIGLKELLIYDLE